jgi:hypothetical protein
MPKHHWVQSQDPNPDPFTRPYRCANCKAGPLYVPLTDSVDQVAANSHESYEGLATGDPPFDPRNKRIPRECGKSS